MRRIRNVVRIVCLCMILVMIFGGCSRLKKQKESNNETNTENQKIEEGSQDKQEKAEKVEDANLEQDSIVLSIGKEGVPFREILAYMYLLKASYEPEFGKEIWDFNMEGQTFERKSLEEVLHLVTEMKIIRKEAKAISLELSLDEADEINVKAENILAKTSPEDVEGYGLTTVTLATIYGDHEIASKMFDVCMNGVDTQISNEEAKQMVVQYLLVMTNGTNRSGVNVEKDEGGRAESLEKAKTLRKKALKADSFYSFAESNTDASVVEQTIGNDSMTDEFIQAAWSLKTGDYSEVVETPEGFYIIYCVNEYDEKATNQEKERRILEEQTNIFEQQYEGWAGKYQVRISNLLWNYDFFNLTNE